MTTYKSKIGVSHIAVAVGFEKKCDEKIGTVNDAKLIGEKTKRK